MLTFKSPILFFSFSLLCILMIILFPRDLSRNYYNLSINVIYQSVRVIHRRLIFSLSIFYNSDIFAWKVKLCIQIFQLLKKRRRRKKERKRRAVSKCYLKGDQKSLGRDWILKVDGINREGRLTARRITLVYPKVQNRKSFEVSVLKWRYFGTTGGAEPRCIS